MNSSFNFLYGILISHIYGHNYGLCGKMIFLDSVDRLSMCTDGICGQVVFVYT